MYDVAPNFLFYTKSLSIILKIVKLVDHPKEGIDIHR